MLFMAYISFDLVVRRFHSYGDSLSLCMCVYIINNGRSNIYLKLLAIYMRGNKINSTCIMCLQNALLKVFFVVVYN